MQNTQIKYNNYNGINVIALTGGSMSEKGFAYGATLKDVLHSTRDYLVKAFTQHGITHQEMVEASQDFYARYSYKFKLFLEGIAQGSDLSTDDVNILNGMETIHHLLSEQYSNYRSEFPTCNSDLAHCAFISIPPMKTETGYSIIGRNYDYPPDIYGKIAANLTITVINDPDTIPTAIIGMPGQIYCPSCTNMKGLFMELNNGMPSGGDYLAQDRESLLINMLEVMQNSDSLMNMHSQMMSLRSDYSLIVSTANQSYAQSYEYSSNASLGMKSYSPTPNEVLVYTNFYLNTSWGNQIPVPTDASTWEGITRRDNLLNLANKSNNFDLEDMKNLMNTPISKGGAYWGLTIYQLIFQPENNMLSVKRSFTGDDLWVDINLNDFYNENYPSSNEDSFPGWGIGLISGIGGIVMGTLGLFLAGKTFGCWTPGGYENLDLDVFN